MVSQNSSNATIPHDTPMPDPEFYLRTVIMSAQSALAALHRGDPRTAAGYANGAQHLLGLAQRDLATLTRPNLAVIR